MKRFLFCVLALILTSCTRPDDTKRVLLDSGYQNVTITGYRWFMCDKHDWFCTGFEATAANGKKVSGAVSAGFLKGNTIRLD